MWSSHGPDWCGAGGFLLFIWTCGVSVHTSWSSDQVPLVEDQTQNMDFLALQKPRRNPGCGFGTAFYQLEQTWHPVLEPLGEMVCVLCTCKPVFQDNKLQLEGNVECQNIKNSCPRVTCPDAAIPPGQCCKVCPGHQGEDPQEAELKDKQNQIRHELPAIPPIHEAGLKYVADDAPPMDQGRARHRDFLALLVGRSTVSEVRTRAVASARFTLTNDQLTYSIKLFRIQGASTMWFQEEHGTVLFEKSLKEFKKDHVCGTWQQMPKLYLNYLQQQQLYIVIGTKKYPEGEISGRVEPHRALKTESLSAILSPTQKDGSGALAMMTFGSDNSLGVIVIHAGVADRKKNTRVSVTFNKKKKRVKVMDLTVLPQEVEIAELWSKPRKRDLKSLVRGRLEIVITERNKELMRGHITYRQSCNVMQAILSPVRDNKSRNPKNAPSSRHSDSLSGSGGVALFRITPKGKLDYSLKFSGHEHVMSKVTVAEPNRGRRSRPICTINLPSTAVNTMSGSCGSVKAETLQKLFQNDLHVTVLSDKQQPTMKGAIKELIFHEYNDEQGVHMLLTGLGHEPVVNSLLVGHAWISVSRLCQLIFLVALDDSQLYQQAGWTPYIKDTSTSTMKILGGVSESIATGSFDVSPDMLKSLNDGQVELGIMTSRHSHGEIGARIEIENSCSEMLTKGNINENLPLNEPIVSNRPSDKVVEDTDDRCMVASILRENGDIWHSEDSPCVTCNCAKGVSNCHAVECPKLACDHPVNLAGECCPQCLNITASIDKKCFFDGDKRHHHFGTIFHPYVIPFGYQKCAVCSCSRGENEVLCVRLPCPELPCPQENAIRKHPQDCCMTCPENQCRGVDQDFCTVNYEPLVNLPPTFPHTESYYEGLNNKEVTDPPPLRSEDIIKTQTACEVQGVMYTNGSEWKPRVGPFGTMPCITCKCLEGTPRCTRETCPNLDCDEDDQIQEQYSCCPSCMSGRTSDKRQHDKR